MKLNIANPETGASKLIEIDDEKKLRVFFDKQMSHEVEADALGDEFKGYVFKIAGGNDKEGFPMMQGVHVNGRVRLLLKKGQKCFRERRDGERKRKSVRGCIVGPDMSVLSLVVVKKGEGELPGITDKYIPRPFGPKRASKIRKLFNLTKEDDVTKYALKKVAKFTTKAGVAKELVKIPKIQRLVTKRKIDAWKRKRLLKQKRQTKNKLEAEAYAKLISDRQEAQRAKRQSVVEAVRRASQKGESKAAEAKPAEAKPAKVNRKRAAPTAKAAKKPVKKATTEKPTTKTVKPAKPAKPVSKKAAAKPAKPVAKKPAAKPVAEKPAKPAAKPAKAAAKAPAKAAAKKAAAKK